MNSLTPAQQREYETAVFEGQDPYDALKALSERVETQNIHLTGRLRAGAGHRRELYDPGPAAGIRDGGLRGARPLRCPEGAFGARRDPEHPPEGVSERELATVVNSMTPAQQREYETAVFEGQDPYDALKALAERVRDPEHPPGGRLRAWSWPPS